MGKIFLLGRGDGRCVPSQGQDLGEELERLADDMVQRPYFSTDRAATIYELAAEAYDMAIGVTIGHGRRDRYADQKKKLLAKAKDLRNSGAE